MECFISFGLNLVKFRVTWNCLDLAVAEFSVPWRNRTLKTASDLSKVHLQIATFLTLRIWDKHGAA